MALCAGLSACPGGKSGAALQSAKSWPRAPKGYGRAPEEGLALQIKDRRLQLPDGRRCAGSDPGCAAPLAALRGKKLTLEVDASSAMGELSAALQALTEALEEGDQACLLVQDEAGQARCIPFRPFSGDEFSAWLDADQPLGKIRVIMRADGLEVVADRGKVPGPDRFGPSLPPVAGRPDFAGLDRLAASLARRFPDETEAALAASAGISIGQAAQALSLLSGPDASRFKRTYLVYP